MPKTWNEEKQKYEYSPTFTLELRLMTTPEDDAILNKRFGICNHIYNVMVKEARKRLSNMYRDHEYKEIMYPYCKTGKFKTGDKKKLAELRKKYGLTEYSFHKYVDAEQTKFKDNCICQRSIAYMLRQVLPYRTQVAQAQVQILCTARYGRCTSCEGETTEEL